VCNQSKILLVLRTDRHRNPVYFLLRNANNINKVMKNSKAREAKAVKYKVNFLKTEK